MQGKREPAETRFWNFIVKGDGCWSWSGAKAPYGYGVFNIKKKMVRAHRFSYELHIGPIPEGMQVLHRCDNPECANPDHLFLGTQLDNIRDMHEKKRASGNIHIPEETIMDIRRRYLPRKVTQRTLARECGCSQQQISRIVTLRNRASVGAFP